MLNGSGESDELDGSNLKVFGKFLGNIQDPAIQAEYVGGKYIIRGVNDAFVETFDCSRQDIDGEPVVERIYPDWQTEQAREIDNQLRSDQTVHEEVTLETADGLREFRACVVPYDEEAAVDAVAVYTDITDRVGHRRQLQVMNRILRHNLRNQSNIISGHTTRLLSELPEQKEEYTESASKIERAAHELNSLAREAQEVREMMESPAKSRPTDCTPHVERTVQDMQRVHPAAEIQTDLPDSLYVNADASLRLVFKSAIENAIEHNPAPEPQVAVRHEQVTADGWVEVHVNDNGSLIPPDERQVLTSNEEITQTNHGSGLGLWAINWAVRSYGGQVSFQQSGLGGNSVRIRLLEAHAE